MNPSAALLIFLVMPMATTAAATEPAWPDGPASEVATFATMLRYHIYADHCSDKLPQLKPEFDSVIETLDRRIRAISAGLLSSSRFGGARNVMVPVEIMDAIKHSFHDMQHNVESRDAASICPASLRSFGDVDDEALETSLTENLTAVQNMSQKFEHARPR